MKKLLSIILSATLFLYLSINVAAQTAPPANTDNTPVGLTDNTPLFTVSDTAGYAVGDNYYTELEPNDYFDQANLIYNDYTLLGSIPDNDIDVFLVSFDTYTAITAITGAEYDSVWVALYDSNGNMMQDGLDYGYDDGVYTKGVVCTLEPGFYYLAVGNSERYYTADYLLYYQATPTSVHTHFKNYQTVTQPADCMYEGYIIDHCSCGFYRIEWLPVTDHKFGDFVPLNDGTMYATCSVCHLEYEAYELYRIKGKNRYATSIAIADATKTKMGIDRFDSVVITFGEKFADALAGSYLAKVKNAPILMTKDDRNINSALITYISNNLVPGGTVYILGGTAAVPQSTEDALVGYNIKRIKGKSRYETNIEILKEAGVTDEEIIVATGNNFADSLSASAVGRPILLVDGKKELTQLQKDYLATLGTNKFYIVGGSGAVGENFESELAEYGTVERIKGKNRYETSIAIAQKFFSYPIYAITAYGENFPDGLCGGPLAMTMNAPLILTRPDNRSAAKSYLMAGSIHSGAVLGGAALIDDATVKDIFSTPEIFEWK